ncbi:MAG: CHAT domain-containing tetratricopeptide repeat protein [Bacteroidota bacterium]
MTPSKKGKQKYAILKPLFLLCGILIPYFSLAQGAAIDQMAQKADSLQNLQAYGDAALIFTQLANTAEAEAQMYRSAQRHLQAAECWYFEDPNAMYMSLYMADSMFAQSQQNPDTLAANIANSWGKLYYKFGYPEEAKAYYQQALELRQKVRPAKHAELMGSYNNLGLVAYFYEDDYRQALLYYRQALEIAAQNDAVPEIWQARLHANLARTFNSLDQNDSVDLALGRALHFYQAGGLKATHPDLIDLQLEVCVSRIDRADFELAERMLESYVEGLQDPELPLATRKKLPFVLELQGDLYRVKRDWQRAQDAYLRAQNSYQEYPADNPLVALKLPQRLAEIALQQGDLARSEQIYLEILTDSNRLDQATAQSIRLNLGQLYELMDKPEAIREQLRNLDAPEKLDAFNRARFYLMQARLTKGDEAEDLYLKAAAIMEQAFKRHPELSSLYWEIAKWYQLAAQPEQGGAYLEKALQANLREGDGEILSLPQQVVNLSSKARYLQEADPDSALRLYLEADSLLSLLGRYYPAEESRTQLRGNLNNFYAGAISLLFEGERELRDAERLALAFELVEKSRANSLRERQQELAILQADFAPALQDSLSATQSRLAHLRNQWFGADSSQKVALQARIAAAKEACLQWNEQLAAAHPDYYALKFVPAVPTLAEVEGQLREGEYLLNYFVEDELVYVFFIASGERLALKLDDDCLAALPDFLSILQSVDSYYEDGTAIEKRYAALGFELYQKLLAPVLADRPQAQSLWIVPDGILGYLPFETLLTQAASESDDFRSFAYLLNSCPLRYSYFNTAANSTPQRNHLAYAGFAPIYQAEGTEMSVLRSSPLQNLAWARKEVIEGQRIWGGEAFLDEAATEQQLMDLAEWPAVLHFSMHALVDDQDALHSRLAFSPTETHGDLMVHEIYQLPIKSQLAVLSACNTGQGPIFENEGIVSLARAFRYAGCPSVLASLWLVDEKAAFDIHGVYFQALADGADKATALQNAKLTYLDQADSKIAAHPFFWASLVQIGESAPIQVQSNMLYYLILLAVALGLGFWGIRRQRKNRV